MKYVKCEYIFQINLKLNKKIHRFIIIINPKFHLKKISILSKK
jgi:hypothetical protein